jgi:Trypsin-like peptidase domain
MNHTRSMPRFVVTVAIAIGLFGCAAEYPVIPNDPTPDSLHRLGIEPILVYSLEPEGEFAVGGGTAIPLGGEHVLTSLHIVAERDVIRVRGGRFHTFEIVDRSRYSDAGLDWAIVRVHGMSRSAVRARCDPEHHFDGDTAVYLVGFPTDTTPTPEAHLSSEPTVLRGAVVEIRNRAFEDPVTFIATKPLKLEGMSGGAVIVDDGGVWTIVRSIQMGSPGVAKSGLFTLADYSIVFSVPFDQSAVESAMSVVEHARMVGNAAEHLGEPPISVPAAASNISLNGWDLDEDGSPDVARGSQGGAVLILNQRDPSN